jgi:hypothetical protein
MKTRLWQLAIVLALNASVSAALAADPPATPAPQPRSVPAGSSNASAAPSGPSSSGDPGTWSTGLWNNQSDTAHGNGPVEQARWYFTGEYLLWWTKEDKVPVLSSTSKNPFDNGILGQPTTEALFGGGGIDGRSRSGFRFTTGLWLDESCKEDGIEFRGFYLAPRTTDYNASSAQFPTLARPFFNVNQQIEFSELTAFPGRFVGAHSIQDSTKLFGAEALGRCGLCSSCNYRVDLYGGFAFYDLEDSLIFHEDFLGLPNAPAPYTNTHFFSSDYFITRNQFYGGLLGLMGEYDYGPLSFEARGALSLGDTHQSILIDGNQVVTPVGSTQTRVDKGDLYALPSNIGRFSRDKFGVIPEAEFNVGYLVTRHLRLFVGYDIFYWNSVVRAGGQLDRNLDITQIPNFPVPGVASAGQTRPAAPRDSTDFWAQGVSFGIEIRY